MDAQEQQREVNQLQKGWAALLRATWIPTVSQSDWPESRMCLIPAAADLTAVDSIKSVSCFLFLIWLCNTQAWNPIVASDLCDEWSYFSVVLISSGFVQSERTQSCTQPPPSNINLRGECAVQSWLMGDLGGFSPSLWLPQAFISLKKRVNATWSRPAVSLVPAGAGRGSEVKVAAAAAAWKANIRLFQSKCVKECSTLI